MNNLLFVLLQVFLQAYSFKRDTVIRLLIAEIKMLRSRISAKRIILTAKEKNLLLDIGVELIIRDGAGKFQGGFYNDHRPH